MNETLMYFLKVNIAIALFYLFYRLFFAGDTFWKTRRYYMLLSILIAFVHPLLSIEGWLDKQESVKTIVVNYAMLPEFTVTPVQQTNWLSMENVLLGIYALVVGMLLIKMLVQLGSILRMKMQGRKQLVQGISIIALEKELTPFSFFNTVFMNPALHNEHETREILAHELTHVRQGHSFDVLLSEMLTIAFWFNPATWLLKGEIRQNLEFLADNKVIESGFDSKTYQYHLLQLSYQTPEAKLGNKFNVSPLKKRIIMMNQQKTSKAGLLKYSLIVQLALALIVSSNAQSVVKKAKKVLETKEVVTEQKTVKTNSPIMGEPIKKQTEPTNQLTDPVMTADTTKIYDVVEKMPQYQGGESALMSYIARNIKYPIIAQASGTQGMLLVRFIVNKEGKVTDTSVIKSMLNTIFDKKGVEVVGYAPKDSIPAKPNKQARIALEKEALRVINAMPEWIPGEQQGKKVSVYYTLPIRFKLE